jgi:hypothetical protein
MIQQAKKGLVVKEKEEVKTKVVAVRKVLLGMMMMMVVMIVVLFAPLTIVTQMNYCTLNWKIVFWLQSQTLMIYLLLKLLSHPTRQHLLPFTRTQPRSIMMLLIVVQLR